MNKKIKLVENNIYNFLIGFWTPFCFLLAIAFTIDDNDGVGVFLTILTIIVYLVLLIPNNINFLLSILMYKGKGTINIPLTGILIVSNILFLSLNKKADNIYYILLFILNIIFIYVNIDCFNVF